MTTNTEGRKREDSRVEGACPARRTGLATILLLGSMACDTSGSGPGPLPPSPPPSPALGARLREIANGLNSPLYLTSPPGDLTRQFVVEKVGRVRIIKDDGLVPTPFLDLTARVSNGSEQGLLGLAFHPQYASNGRFVVNYTTQAGDTRVAVYRVSSDPDRADPASEQVILAVDQPFANHNGGMLAFGPDGHLYIGLGDGGSGGDPQNHAQNRNSLLGKILRVAVSGSGAVSIPADNPFAGQSGARPEIWSYGLRNPWRFSFDRLTGDLYIGDVGQNAREEIDVSTDVDEFGRGRNYGWNIMEGTGCFSGSGCTRTGLTLPVLEYGHAEGCSVTGGYVYRGTRLGGSVGHYFYADYCEGWVRSFRLGGTTVSEHREWASLRPGGQLLSFGEDARGELYILDSSGRVFRIEPAP
jgi:glucose/arabinose dehydrogenase